MLDREATVGTVTRRSVPHDRTNVVRDSAPSVSCQQQSQSPRGAEMPCFIVHSFDKITRPGGFGTSRGFPSVPEDCFALVCRWCVIPFGGWGLQGSAGPNSCAADGSPWRLDAGFMLVC